MTDDRKSGLALIAGSIGTILTMAAHPVGGGTLAPAQLERLAIISGLDHSLAMVSILMLVLGACGLTRRLAAPDRLAFAALVFYIAAACSILVAAAVSGFIVPDIMRHMVRDTPSAAPVWHIAIVSVFQVNQAFAGIYTVAASIAVVLWSASALRHGGLGRGIAIYGCILSPLLTLAICAGHLRLDVHGMAIVAVTQAIWFIGAGSQLYGQPAAARQQVQA